MIDYDIHLLNDTGFYARVVSECCIEFGSPIQQSEATGA